MIKKLHQLKAKKGFTLVELLVVIAIIGILAAILIPLMSNFMRSARVSSANSTAASAQGSLTYLFQQERVKNRGITLGIPGTIFLRFGEVRGDIGAAGGAGTAFPAADVTFTGLTYTALPGVGLQGAIYTTEATPSFAAGAHIATLEAYVAYTLETEFPEASNSTFFAYVDTQGIVRITMFAPGNITAVLADFVALINVTTAPATPDNPIIIPTLVSNGLMVQTQGGLARSSVLGSDPQT